MEKYDYYILNDDNQPVKVIQPRWERWMREVHISRICVAETHLMRRGCVATTITTRFTGCDPHHVATLCLDAPLYLWETKVAYMHGEPCRKDNPEDALKCHEQRVQHVISLLKKDNFIVERRDIKVPTME